jgi:hypothetical protein
LHSLFSGTCDDAKSPRHFPHSPSSPKLPSPRPFRNTNDKRCKDQEAPGKTLNGRRCGWGYLHLQQITFSTLAGLPSTCLYISATTRSIRGKLANTRTCTWSLITVKNLPPATQNATQMLTGRMIVLSLQASAAETSKLCDSTHSSPQEAMQGIETSWWNSTASSPLVTIGRSTSHRKINLNPKVRYYQILTGTTHQTTQRANITAVARIHGDKRLSGLKASHGTHSAKGFSQDAENRRQLGRSWILLKIPGTEGFLHSSSFGRTFGWSNARNRILDIPEVHELRGAAN